MLQTILLIAMILISVALAGLILLQKSEGGALGMGGGPSGFMTARGAGNLLTKTTWVLAFMFFACAIGLTILGNVERSSASIVGASDMGELIAPAPSQAPVEDPSAPVRPAAPSLQDLETSLSGVSERAPAQPAPAN
ncbi:MAG: preprotein translocase subunit SecG [Brevundimonas sp.]|uniref:preprotein translocase subunit SecG n=1 Tax=Brevundimonas sp. TaxID=1871086 RepID=UPI002727CE72|nr:preprotein translocase subunit SecG [Brevundimonas sp.]MDZ4321434.1 preprotein translocase subunit SecG [Phenylobacterium sp.]MDO9586345.1 preprotein translocase subunit SecG [Brevundimonas sp.]MDP3368891.1 preprotein translocase subunit SecG [Brevundimonas sp.]MDP3656933.1 preprotein translocase subunit SecG [Brevundimonas sp.]MDZ4113344.1 preprotein translocase subunit SecG [Brevundimonas sp.]